MSNCDQAIKQGIPVGGALLAFWTVPRKLPLSALRSDLERLSGVERLNAVLSREQLGQGRVELVTDDLLVHDIDPLEDRLVELAAQIVARVEVELIRVLEQPEMRLNERLPGRQVDVDGLEFSCDPFFVAHDQAEPLPNLRLGQCAVGGKVEEVVLLLLQFRELLRQLQVQHATGRINIRERLFHALTDSSDELRAKPDAPIVLLNCGLDAVDARVRGIAGVVLRSAAEEVPVFARLLSAHGSHHDHPACFAILEETSPAPHRSLQVVVVATPALPGLATLVHQFLHALEELFVNERLVSAGEAFALVLELAEVVPVA